MTDRVDSVMEFAGCPASVVLAVMLLTGCADSGGPDPCRDHYQVHPGHVNEVATLQLSFDAAGGLAGTFRLPADMTASYDRLSAPGALFTLKEQVACESGFNTPANPAEWAFHANCGGEDVMKSFEVTVFDTLPTLDEVAVMVTTPATSKSFAILRSCPSPIHRLE